MNEAGVAVSAQPGVTAPEDCLTWIYLPRNRFPANQAMRVSAPVQGTCTRPLQCLGFPNRILQIGSFDLSPTYLNKIVHRTLSALFGGTAASYERRS